MPSPPRRWYTRWWAGRWSISGPRTESERREDLRRRRVQRDLGVLLQGRGVQRQVDQLHAGDEQAGVHVLEVRGGLVGGNALHYLVALRQVQRQAVVPVVVEQQQPVGRVAVELGQRTEFLLCDGV